MGVMPILWRYLLQNYFRIFLLCMGGFIATLLVTRFLEIAQFASSSASLPITLLFTLYQIPSIFPIATTISCLIAAILLFQRLSHLHELTALRSLGLGLKTIVFPMFLAGVFLMLVNFLTVAELIPRCRSLSKKLIYQATAANPLILLQKETMIKLKDVFVDMKVLRSGKEAEDVLFVTRNLSNGRLGVMTAKHLSIEGDLLTGNGVTFISSIDSKREGFDHLVIENQAKMHTKAAHLAQFVQDSDFSTSHEHLPLNMLFAKLSLNYEHSKDPLSRATIDLARRVSLTLAPLLFTLMGAACGMEIGRIHKNRGILLATLFSAFFMACFFSARSFRHTPLIPLFLYLAPHPLLALMSFFSFKRLAKGIE